MIKMTQRQDRIDHVYENFQKIESFFQENKDKIKSNNILDLISEIKKKLTFYSLQNIINISNFTDNLIKNYLIINHHDDYDFLNEHLTKISKDFNNINSAPFEDIILTEATPENLILIANIVKTIFQKNNLDYPDGIMRNIETINLNYEKFESYIIEEIYKNFIEIYNLIITEKYKLAAIKLKDNHNEIRSLYLDIEQDKLTDEVHNLDKNTKKIKEGLGLAENEELIKAFKIQADEYSKNIQNYTHIIIFVFITISLFILLKILINRLNFELYELVMFGSLIISLSALLTYLIQERRRLVNLQTYCIKCYLELSALPKYTADLEKEQIQKLKIDLASVYFKGHINDKKLNTSTNEITTINNALDTTTKLLTNIKDIFKK